MMSRLSIALLFLLLASGCGRGALDHPAADDISLAFELLDQASDGGGGFRAALTLSNQGQIALGPEGWELYFNFRTVIEPASLPPAVSVTHINGDFFRLEPTVDFVPLAPGEELRIEFDGPGWLIKESDAPVGFYFIFEDAKGERSPPQAVADPELGSFVDPQRSDHVVGGFLPAPTPASRFEQNRALRLLEPEEVGPIVPTPLALEKGKGRVPVDASWEIRHAEGLQGEAAYLAGALEPVVGGTLAVVEGSAEDDGPAISLAVDEVTVAGRRKGEGEEAYLLVVDPDRGIEIVGSDPAGVFYGIQSLRSLMEAEASREAEAIVLASVRIEDAPRFHYRGLHLDVARNFQTQATVLKLLDLMAIYKLNRFHFHLSDDEGWRLAIDGLPELTEVGGRRGHTTTERDHLVPSFGSGPDPARFPGSGHYTRQDFIEIVRHARDRHIEVIPEIDVPGHARAAVKAMESRFATLAARGLQDEAERYRLVHPQDRSQYVSIQDWNDNVMDVCLPSTYRFLEAVFEDIVAMFDEAGAPLTTVHVGGDEVPAGVWERSPACERLLDEDAGVGAVADLPGYFLRQVSRLLSERGLVVGGWEEIALTRQLHGGSGPKTPNEAFLGRGFRPYIWNNVWGQGAEDLGYRLANAGYQVVLAQATNLYFDLAYDRDPKEPGYAWAGFVDTRKPFEFVPFDLFKSAKEDLLGRPIDAEVAFAGHVRLSAEGRRNVLGMQAQVWGENAKGEAMMEYLAFPKLLGLAERAWAPQPAWARIADPARRQAALEEAWNGFANRLGQRELARLDRLHGGVSYRLPPPGAVLREGRLEANVAFPGLAIRYTTDGSEPTAASTLYAGPAAVAGTVRLKTFDSRGRGSRTAVVAGSG